MALSDELVSKFVEIANSNQYAKSDTTVYGTVVITGDKKYVKIDGSDLLTPCQSTTSIEDGDRVIVEIKNRIASITGNITSPSASNKEVTGVFDEIEAQTGRIDDLVSDNITIKDKLVANEAEIGNLTADNVTIKDTLKANKAEIEDLYAKKLSADVADIKFATIENLDATNANIHNLEADYGNFVVLTSDKFSAIDAEIKRLDADNITFEDLEGKYANIDFSNIGKAAIENLFADSGLIKDLVVGDGTITGELVGVTIKGDLIEGNTIVADKLVIKGSDGLYYKLNTDGITTEAEQTEYNSLNGQIIQAKSITATKIAVDDLVAFDATIAGMHMTDGSIYSGVKDSVDNTTRGFYLDKNGQMALGGSNNFIKYFKDQNRLWKLDISASSIRFGTSGKDVEETIGQSIISSEEEFYRSSSPTILSNGEWVKEQPQWKDGTFIWRRTFITYGNGTTEYTPSENGVCITGNTGAQGDKGEDAVVLQILSSNGQLFKNSIIATSLTVTIIVADKIITSSKQMYETFGLGAFLTWFQKRFRETEFTKIEQDDSRLSDNGFILTIDAQDVFTQTVFNCELNY